MGLQRCLPQIDAWVAQAKKVAKMLASFPSIRVNPAPPHTNAFQLYIDRDPKTLLKRHMQLAQETGSFLFFWLDAAPVPGFSKTEIQCMEYATDIDLERLQSFVSQLLEETPQTVV